MKNLSTKWGRELDRDHVWQEYPRPSMVRDSYLNLNGYWDYAILTEEKLPDCLPAYLAADGGEKWDGQILVPFSPECALSGVNRILQPGEVLLYHRKIDCRDLLTEKKAERESAAEYALRQGERILLHFGAVDQECVIYVDGSKAGGHVGGYLPFTLDITDQAGNPEEEHDLLVAVTDWTEERPHARGKQRLERGGQFPSLFYTPQSGIWQSVWMEKVPACYVQELLVKSLYDEAAAEVEIQVRCPDLNKAWQPALCREEKTAARQKDGENAASEKAVGADTAAEQESKEKPQQAHTVSIRISQGGYAEGQTEESTEKQIAASAQAQLRKEKDGIFFFTARIPLPDFHPWSPEDPFLYDVEVSLPGASACAAGDRVTGYFAMRRFSVEKDGQGIWRLFFNNKPYFFNGVLDQGYWPESLMTAPCEEALAYDIRLLKTCGFNTIRKHIKVEPERFYYLCDRLGMFVWQDVPNGGGKYHMNFTTVLPNVLDRAVRRMGDGPKMYGIYAREDAQGREQYYRDLQDMVRHLRRFPCIALWTAFNEGWGQFDARKAVKMIRQVDDTRFVNEACGWYDQGSGDLYSIHNYWRRLRVRPQKDRVVALTEYGGFAWPVPEHMYSQDKFGYQYYRSKEELTKAYGDALKRDVFPNLKKGLSAAIYTQTSDIETEINGLMTYDRAVTKMDERRLAKLHRALQKKFQEITEDSAE